MQKLHYPLTLAVAILAIVMILTPDEADMFIFGLTGIFSVIAGTLFTVENMITKLTGVGIVIALMVFTSFITTSQQSDITIFTIWLPILASIAPYLLSKPLSLLKPKEGNAGQEPQETS